MTPVNINYLILATKSKKNHILTKNGVRFARNSIEETSTITFAKIALKQQGVKLLEMFKRNSRRTGAKEQDDSFLPSESVKLHLKEQWLIEETEKIVKVNDKMTLEDFDIIQTIGHGGFGVVRLVRQKTTSDVYAMKSLRKADILKKGQNAHVKAERDLLCKASQVSEWIVHLISTFQDDTNLYFVMDYMPGGDLLGLLIKYDIFPENFTKHYLAEMVLAIEEVHKLG
jgi:serine/threonine protein kinase